MGGTCRHVFSVKNSSCPPCVSINITVFATNTLGDGALSDEITIGKHVDKMLYNQYIMHVHILIIMMIIIC